MVRLRVLVGIATLLAGCADVQRVRIEEPHAEVTIAAADPAFARSHARSLAFKSPAARVHVFTSDLLNGDHHLYFKPVRGTYRIDPLTKRARLHMEIGMKDLTAEKAWIADFAGTMLAVHSHPVTIIDANVDPIPGEEGSSRRLVTGNVHLRGVERGLRFYATVTPEAPGPDSVHFYAVFDMSRSAFGIRARFEDGDALVRDDFTVTFDIHATPEKVEAEEID